MSIQKVRITDPEKLIPTFNRVVIEIEPIEEKTKGGVWVPKGTIYRDINEGGVGYLFKLGEDAFAGCDYVPDIGANVITNTFKGLVYETEEDAEGKKRFFRIMQDTDIIAIDEAG